MERKKVSVNKKEKIQSRIVLLIGLAVMLLGIMGIINRNNSADKFIGTVYVVTSQESVELEGIKVKKQYEEKITDLDVKPLSEISGKFKEFTQSGNENIAVSFTGTYEGSVLYSVYDMEYNSVYEDRTSLKVPMNLNGGCIVKVEVKWGKPKNNVTTDYYFKIKY